MPRFFKGLKRKKSMEENQTQSEQKQPLRVFIDEQGRFLRVQVGEEVLEENVAYELYQESDAPEEGGSNEVSQEAAGDAPVSEEPTEKKSPDAEQPVDTGAEAGVPEVQPEAAPVAPTAPADAGDKCLSCQGSGLVNQETLCSVCQGTGKI